LHKIYRYLDKLCDTQKDKIQELSVEHTKKVLGGKIGVVFYDVTSLQKDCNVHLDLSAEKTLEIAQGLYEKKLISYPRTSSRYIPEDVFREIPSLLHMALRMDKFKHFADEIDTLRPAKRSVGDKKITDHLTRYRVNKLFVLRCPSPSQAEVVRLRSQLKQEKLLADANELACEVLRGVSRERSLQSVWRNKAGILQV
jgi:hypothetical protein